MQRTRHDYVKFKYFLQKYISNVQAKYLWWTNDFSSSYSFKFVVSKLMPAVFSSLYPNASQIPKITDASLFFVRFDVKREFRDEHERSPAKNRNDRRNSAIVVGMDVFADRRFLFPSHPSVDRFASLPPPPSFHLSIRDHYLGPIMTSIIFCYCSVYRVMASRGLEYRGCSLAPRRIIRCRYAITTFASAKWKRFRFFAPASDGRWLRFSEPTIAFGVAERGEKARGRMEVKAPS